jgi:hypothetical protein
MADEPVTAETPELPKKRYGTALLRRRLVYCTGESRGDHVLVLIPYAGTELINPRPKFMVLADHAKPHLRRGLHYPGHFHEQWVAERNLS